MSLQNYYHLNPYQNYQNNYVDHFTNGTTTNDLTIDWEYANEIISIIEQLLGRKYPSHVNYLRTWYEDYKYGVLPITDPKVVEWFRKGFAVLRLILTDLSEEQRIVGQIWQNYYSRYRQIPSDIKARYNLWVDAQQQLLNCKGRVGDWLVPIYRYLSTLYPNDATLANAAKYFDSQCTRIQNAATFNQ